MIILFTLLFLASCFCLLLGLIRPAAVSLFLPGDFNRKKIAIIFGTAIIVFFILSVITASKEKSKTVKTTPPTTQTTSNQDTQSNTPKQLVREIKPSKDKEIPSTNDQGGSADEAYKTGEKYFGTQDYAEALTWYKKAADQGQADAQMTIGTMYLRGIGVTKDYTEALNWFRKAADQGHAYGQSAIGLMYYNGDGVIQDYAEALKWFRKAADQENADAQAFFGLMYYKGEGVTQDYAEAMKWLRKAADQGHKDARRLMEELESKMSAKAQTNRADCRITERTLGFRDKEALDAATVAEGYRQFSGDSEPFQKLIHKLLAEGRLVDLDPGEKAELLKVDQTFGQSTMQIRIPGKGVMWIDGTDVRCR